MSKHFSTSPEPLLYMKYTYTHTYTCLSQHLFQFNRLDNPGILLVNQPQAVQGNAVRVGLFLEEGRGDQSSEDTQQGVI